MTPPAPAYARILYQIARHQAQNLANLSRGLPVTTPSLHAMTLEDDDVALAARWLGDRADWHDEAITAEFERAFARAVEAEYAFAFLGARVALSACVHALALEPGDEVILPGYTCVVVPNALRFAGVVPVFADIELETYGLDVSGLDRHVSPRTRAVLLHHLYGLVSRDYTAIVAWARSRGLAVIEDCAQATGASHQGRPVGSLGDLAIYSTEVSKVITTVQGGLATTRDPALAARLSDYRDHAPLPDDGWIAQALHNVPLLHAQWKHPERWWRADVANVRHGAFRLVSTTRDEARGEKPANYGQRMPAPLAALGLNQLAKMERFNARRREAAGRWDAWCQSRGHRPPTVVAGSQPVFLRYPLLVPAEKKRNLDWARRELGVTPGVWFTSPLHPAPADLPSCPNGHRAAAECINLPTLLD